LLVPPCSLIHLGDGKLTGRVERKLTAPGYAAGSHRYPPDGFLMISPRRLTSGEVG